MDAVEFLMNRARFCRDADCGECEVYDECDASPEDITKSQAEKLVNHIEQWAKEHPVKTRQSEFLKMFPMGCLDSNGVLDILPCKVNQSINSNTRCPAGYCCDCKRNYWLQEV